MLNSIPYINLQNKFQGNGCYHYIKKQNKHIIFFPIPKTGITSFRHSLGIKLNGNYNYNYIENYPFYNKLQKNNAINITILRDPIQRFISGYLEVCKRGNWKNHNHIYKTKFFSMKDNKKRFLTCLEEIEEGIFFDQHLSPHIWYLYHNGKPINIKYYIINNNPTTYKKTFDYFCKKENIYLKYFHMHKKPEYKKRIIKSYLNNKIKERIYKLYYDDYKLYQKELKNYENTLATNS